MMNRGLMQRLVKDRHTTEVVGVREVMTWKEETAIELPHPTLQWKKGIKSTM
jgi:hypothetical protein